ncbi:MULTISPECIES: cysteine-rich KTR domain-containing protein [Clostridia]|uniref:cysteine-rich KTR domain-containing protein n=1 Tax=Clostridia TaxID=186801 RepID=UPI002A7D822E|nr:cysteine-rich KTR domain-containing protein [Dysosmobacter sp.]MDY3020438.1 cysteine-rich KTR domain-containing protein [Oscillospiraceae bacterium]MDY5613371.1 cysteine-rich KTR domain-containing protein [Dysosmobacter sp.]
MKYHNDSYWVRCPTCNSKTRIKVLEKTVLLNFPLYCPKCKKETIISIINLKMTQSKEPDA